MRKIVIRKSESLMDRIYKHTDCPFCEGNKIRSDGRRCEYWGNSESAGMNDAVRVKNDQIIKRALINGL